jgi:hypothetical protein
MLRSTKNLRGGAGFDDLAAVQNGDLIGEMYGHGEIVGDEEIGEAELGLEVEEEIGDLGLDGTVEGRESFVEEKELRFESEGASEGEALLLAATELVSRLVGRIARQGDEVEEVEDFFLAFGGGEDVLDDERFGDEVESGPARVERASGILEDELDLRAELAELAFGEGGEFVLVEEDAAGSGAFEAGDAECESAFAGAGFAKEGERRSGGNFQANVLQGGEFGFCGEGFTDGVALGEIFDAQDWLRSGGHCGTQRASENLKQEAE